MLDIKFLEVLNAQPDSALAIVTQGLNEPHVINSWNSYVQINSEDKLLIPAGGMIQTQKNVEVNNNIKVTISNREVMGKNYKGTGFETIGDMFDCLSLFN